MKPLYNIGDGRITGHKPDLQYFKNISLTMVYVLNKNGQPLMPTERHGKVRRMLRDGKAHVVRLEPFTIQLDYTSEEKTQEISLGIDAGSKHIGVSATTKNKELLVMQVEERTDIVELLSTRRESRRTRRNRKLRHRAARFDNRRRKEGWVPPSVENRIQTHLRVIRLVHSILPIKKTTIEIAQFDLQKIKNSDISSIEYQQGEQFGSPNVREYVIARDRHTCQICKGTSKDPILNVHHIESRKTGSNAPNNLITLCKTCHSAYHDNELNLSFKRGISFRHAAFMNILQKALQPRKIIHRLASNEFPNVHFTYGYITKDVRIKNKIEKTHCADAYCIAGNIEAKRLPLVYMLRMQRRHNRSLQIAKPAKGGRRRPNIAPHWIQGTHLQQYDIVEWNGCKAFITGSSNGSLYLKDTQGNYVARYNNGKPKKFNPKTVKFIRRKRGSMIIYTINQSTTL